MAKIVIDPGHGEGKMRKMDARVAAYVRLSREDGDKLESDSVGNQKTLLQEFIRRREGLKLIDLYIDDGWSGTNFERPSFQRMIRDIEGGRIDCVIVKDLSRFGRDYLETGRYLERYFPQHNIRFISVLDGIDSEKRQYDLMMPIKNLFNEQYARDISKKVHAAVRTKQEAGQFIGAFASYGYQKSPENKNKLVVDPYAAEIVKKIFSMYGEGYSKTQIARWLNEHQILPPSEYKRQNGERYRNGNCLGGTACWTYSTVYKILQNEMYVGNMVQGKKYQEMHRRQKMTRKEEWVVVEKTQEAIIDKTTWERVQRMMQRQTRVVGSGGEQNRFAGLLRCADCGRMLVRKGEGEKSRYYCGSYIRSGRSCCTPHTVTYAVLMELLSRDFEKMIPMVEQERERLRQEMLKDRQKEVHRAYKKLEAECETVLNLKREVYEDFKKGILSEEEKNFYMESYREKEKSLRMQMDCLEGKKKFDTGQDSEVQKETAQGKERMEAWMKRAVLAEMMEEIVVGEGKIELVYRF
ncbi:MAG: recombinase family protein [Lachnospiraceae bacterium]|nr:recombinase family protein [Robinsoniella sp.]MDY3766539.1 recombinase family protein [Lachnospiraceae bacterium]